MLRADSAQPIVDEFGLGSQGVLTGPVARGEVGQVWKLVAPAGVFAVKEPFEAPDESATDDEAAFQELGIAADVLAPRIVRTTAGRVLADIDGAAIRVYEWVDLCPPDRGLDPAAVGAAVARLHRVVYEGHNGIHPWYTDPVGRHGWESLVADLVAADSPFADLFEERVDELVGLEQLLEMPVRVQTCHRDLFADNVLATTTGDVCIIDWENSGLSDPAQEIAVVLFEFAGGGGERARTLYGAYRDEGGPGLVVGPRSFSMAIAQLGHIGHLSARRWLADPSAAERKRNEARVDEFLRDGITRHQIDLILDSITS